jgi:hypothetical protein
MIAAALDPRFKRLAGIPSTEHAALWSLVASEALVFRKRLRALQRPAAASSSSSSSSSASSATAATAAYAAEPEVVWGLLDDMGRPG